MTQCQFLPPRLTREELQDAIARPPKHGQFNGSIDPEVVSELIAAMGDPQDQLPLIQHALLRMWKLAEAQVVGWVEARDPPTEAPLDESNGGSRASTHPTGITITREQLTAIGGVANALNQHADQLFNDLPQMTGLPEAPSIAQRLFCALCQSGGDGRRVRRLSTVTEVCQIIKRHETVPLPRAEVEKVVEVFTA